MPVDMFAIDYERLAEVLISIVVFSFLIERALSTIFENRRFIKWADGREATPAVVDQSGAIIQQSQDAVPKKSGVKELIASIVCVAFCFWQGFDAITIILQSASKPHPAGMILTGLIIAGGSKASMGLFKDLLGFMSSAEKERKQKKDQ